LPRFWNFTFHLIHYGKMVVRLLSLVHKCNGSDYLWFSFGTMHNIPLLKDYFYFLKLKINKNWWKTFVTIPKFSMSQILFSGNPKYINSFPLWNIPDCISYVPSLKHPTQLGCQRQAHYTGATSSMPLKDNMTQEKSFLSNSNVYPFFIINS
jgi:hypothetical protein